jgi:hypothetical protein
MPSTKDKSKSRTLHRKGGGGESKLLSKNLNLKSYWTVIRPVITYASETWVLKESMKQKLLIIEEGY